MSGEFKLIESEITVWNIDCFEGLIATENSRMQWGSNIGGSLHL